MIRPSAKTGFYLARINLKKSGQATSPQPYFGRRFV
jgi:hypothetical protein